MNALKDKAKAAAEAVAAKASAASEVAMEKARKEAVRLPADERRARHHSSPRANTRGRHPTRHGVLRVVSDPP